GAGGDAPFGLRGRLFRQAALAHQVVQAPADLLLPAGQSVLGHVVQRHRIPGHGRQLGDPVTHGAGAQHRNALYLHAAHLPSIRVRASTQSCRGGTRSTRRSNRPSGSRRTSPMASTAGHGKLTVDLPRSIPRRMMTAARSAVTMTGSRPAPCVISVSTKPGWTVVTAMPYGRRRTRRASK